MGVTGHGLAAIVKTSGNQDVHIILRGANKGPNYAKPFVDSAVESCMKARPDSHSSIMIDCSRKLKFIILLFISESQENMTQSPLLS
jgi:3-deoxy-7-phosphoheptulonate synthase